MSQGFRTLLALGCLLLATVPSLAAEGRVLPRQPLWTAAPPVGDGPPLDAQAYFTVHLPPNPTGTAIVICPGGGYGGLALEPEGTGIAKWLNQHGIAGIVLEYRLPGGRSKVPLLDAQRALRTARHHAKDWGIDPRWVGIMGFSAGGHLASTAATHFDTGNPAAEDPIEHEGSRPDFAVLVYPVITLGTFTHGGSKQNLLGSNPSPELLLHFSNERQVTRETPPAFLAHALDDTPVPPENSRLFHEALRLNGVESKYLELESGGHGLNGYKGPMWDAWQRESMEWVKSLRARPAAIPTPAPSATAPTLRNQQDFDRAMQALSNWGRWGATDELGATRLITPTKRKLAASLVREGISVSLARTLEKSPASDNGSPFQHWMDRAGTNNPGYSVSDTYKISYHGLAHTHIDSLCHMFVKGLMYNGFPQTEVRGDGAHKLGIHHLKSGLVSRGILMDIPALKNVPFLEPGTAITPEDLDAWEAKIGTRVSAGDIVLIRTGRWARRETTGAWGNSFAGLHGTCAYWIRHRDVAVLGSDAASDVLPSGVEGVSMPIHQLCLVAMGTWILDNCDLESLAAECQRRKRWEFMLVTGPMAVTGGTGSPVNPIAVF